MADKRIYDLVQTVDPVGKFFAIDKAGDPSAEKYAADALVNTLDAQIIGGEKIFNSDININALTDNGITVLDSGMDVILSSAAITPQLIMESFKITNVEYEKTNRLFRWTVWGSWGGSGTLDFHLKLGATTFITLSIPNTFAGYYRSVIEFGANFATNTKAVIGHNSQGGVYMAGDVIGTHGTGTKLECLMDMSSAAGSFSVLGSYLEAIN